jgi:integrase
MQNVTHEGQARKAGRPRKGSLYLTKSGWGARYWADVDGELVRVTRLLGTHDKRVANRKLARLVAEQTPATEDARREETVSAYAADWLDRREARGVRAVEYERVYFERVWKPAIGHKALSAVTAADIRGVLDDVATGKLLSKRGTRYSRQSIAHMRGTIARVFQSAWKDELVPENRVARVDVPDVDEERKPRTVLTDPEIGALVAHPKADPEIRLLVLLSRTIGGLRAGDLNALDWQAFGPDFATCTFVRRKTRRKRPMPQTLEVPSPVRPFIAAWHERQGKPESGPVFPVRRGKRAGKQKKASNMSYADRLRRELLRAGITRHELHHETPTTLPVDFHSTRRAYATALARIGLNEQTAMVLTGHSDPKVHQRYVEAASIRALPAAAVPMLDPEAAKTVLATSLPESPANDGGCARQPTGTFGAGNGIRTRDPKLGKLVLYQLSYSRETWWSIAPAGPGAKGGTPAVRGAPPRHPA